MNGNVRDDMRLLEETENDKVIVRITEGFDNL